MRLTKRVWQLQGYLFIEPADGHGAGYWIDHLGRIGVEHDSGPITWLQAEADHMAIVEIQPTLDMAQLQLEHLRLFGVVGQKL